MYSYTHTASKHIWISVAGHKTCCGDLLSSTSRKRLVVRFCCRLKPASTHGGMWWALVLTCPSSSSHFSHHALHDCCSSLPSVTIATMTMRTCLLSRRWNGSESGGWPTMLGSACVCGTSMRHSRSWAGCVRCTWRVTNLRLSCWSCTRPWPSSWVWSNRSEVSVTGSVLLFDILSFKVLTSVLSSTQCSNSEGSEKSWANLCVCPVSSVLNYIIIMFQHVNI